MKINYNGFSDQISNHSQHTGEMFDRVPTKLLRCREKQVGRVFSAIKPCQAVSALPRTAEWDKFRANIQSNCAYINALLHE